MILSGLMGLVQPQVAVAQGTVLPPEPPAQDCTMSSPRSRAADLLPALRRGFGVQYWGDTYSAEALAAQPHGILIIEITKIGAPYSDTGREVSFTPEEISTIGRDGKRPVLGYLNVSEIETYRDYWIDHAAAREDGGDQPIPQWHGPHTGHGDHLAAYWTHGWKDILLARVDRLMEAGADGLFLDDVLHYYSHALDETLRWPEGERPAGPADAPGFALEMMRLVEILAERARAWNCDALIIVNNGAFIGRDAAGGTAAPDSRAAFASYLGAIDAIMVENLSAPNTHPHTLEALKEDFQDNGVPVLALDIATQFPEVEPGQLRETIAEKAARSGVFPYVALDSAYSQLNPPIILPPQGPAASE